MKGVLGVVALLVLFGACSSPSPEEKRQERCEQRMTKTMDDPFFDTSDAVKQATVEGLCS